MDIYSRYIFRVLGVLNLVQCSFHTQHMLEPTRGKNVLDIILSSQNEFNDDVKVCEPLG